MLGEALVKLKETHDWNKFMKPTLISYNTSQQANIYMMSYYLIYERDSKLLIMKAVLSGNIILDRVIELIYKIPIFRKSAKVAINRTQ